MQITGSGTSPLLQLGVTPRALKGLPLRDGQTVTATVVGGGADGKFGLELAGKIIEVSSSLRLTAGMTLQLRVEQQNNQTLLHLDDKSVRQLIHSSGLRQSLPLQEPLKPLFERLQQLVTLPVRAERTTATPATSTEQTAATNTSVAAKAGNGTSTTASPTPQKVEQAITRLIAVLPALTRLQSADGLRQAIAYSGLFLENNLLQPQAANRVDRDVKTALLRLARTIRQSLATEGGTKGETPDARNRETLQSLLRQVDAGVARLQLHQLNALSSQQQQGDERQVMTLELPLYHPQEKSIDYLQLKIRREKDKARSGAEDCWSVRLQLNPSGYGEITAVVTLSGGRVATTFWCEQEQTGQLFREQLHALEQRLNDQGLEVGRCSALTGQPPAEQDLDTPPSGTSLIDTRA